MSVELAGVDDSIVTTPSLPKVLVIDDDDQVRQTLKRVLLYAKFDVLEAATAEEGVTISTEQRPDVVVSDVRLPGMSGLQLVQRLRAGPATFDTPVLLVSGKLGEDEHPVAGLQCTDFLPKPFLFSDLVQKIRALVSGPSAARA